MNTDKIYAESIAKEYAPKDASKVKALKRLDRKAKQKAMIFGYSFGSIMALVLGFGMCLALGAVNIGTSSFVLGIIIGIVGIVGVTINPIIYNKLLEEGKQKYGADIMELAKQISEEE